MKLNNDHRRLFLQQSHQYCKAVGSFPKAINDLQIGHSDPLPRLLDSNSESVDWFPRTWRKRQNSVRSDISDFSGMNIFLSLLSAPRFVVVYVVSQLGSKSFLDGRIHVVKRRDCPLAAR
ncbi:Transmembrane protein [Trichinella spiralis]|uniref:Transmembrane protein n=1 Tax=Trichinella spiralis TaxID=6334 RepID=A0ABR3KJ94_TRISP